MNTLGTILPIAVAMPGPLELVLILLVAVLLFGAKRIPEIASSIGKAIREFKGGIKEIDKDLKQNEGK